MKFALRGLSKLLLILVAVVSTGTLVEFVFRKNQSYGWWASPSVELEYFKPKWITRSYDLSGIDLEYLKNVVPYSLPHDFDDPEVMLRDFWFQVVKIDD